LHAVGPLDVLEFDDRDLDAPLLSVSEGVSSRVWRPTTVRSVVCAIWLIAEETFSMATTERTASSTRK
jgi:hypothetical protein